MKCLLSFVVGVALGVGGAFAYAHYCPCHKKCHCNDACVCVDCKCNADKKCNEKCVCPKACCVKK